MSTSCIIRERNWKGTPWGWNKKIEYMENEGVQFQEYDGRRVGGSCHKEIAARYDSFEEVLQDGSVNACRYGWECLRTVYDVYCIMHY